MDEPQENNAVPEKKKINWGIALLVSFLAGSIGADRFLMGHVCTGIIKFLLFISMFFTFGLSAIAVLIWWAIDFFMILAKYKFKGVEWVDKTV